MNPFLELKRYLESFNVYIAEAIYPRNNGAIISSVDIPLEVKQFEHEKSYLLRGQNLGTEVFEVPENLGQTGIHLLVRGDEMEDSLISVAKISVGRKRRNDFQQRLIGALVYHSTILADKVAPGQIHLLFPASLRSHVGAKHTDSEYLKEAFHEPFGSRPLPVMICNDDEHYLLEDLRIGNEN